MSGIYGEDRLLQLLPCVAGRHDHERHLREGEGDGVIVWWEDGQAVGPHTGLLQPSRLAAALTSTTVCSRSATTTSPSVWTEANGGSDGADGGGDPDRGTDGGGNGANGGGDPDGGDDPDRGGDPNGRADGDRGSDSDGGADEGGDGDGGGDLDGDASVEGGRRDARPVDWTGPRSHRRPSSPPPTPTASYGSPPPVVMNRERMR
jgi:hypothetical protein